MRRAFIIVIVQALLGFGAVQAAESDAHGSQAAPHGPDWVEQKIQACASCHGPKGAAETPNFPILAGQYADYLYHTLKEYRDGDRKNPIMASQVQGLTDAQLKALAKYYAKQEGPLYTPVLGK